MTEKSYTITLKVKYETDGTFIGARLLKGRSGVDEQLLVKLNDALSQLKPVEKSETIDNVAFNNTDLTDSKIETIMVSQSINVEDTVLVKTTVDIGNDAEISVMNALVNIGRFNSEFNVYDSSSQTNHGDIMVEYKGKKICIEVKNYSGPVPIAQIDKFHKSIAHEEYDIGLIIQMQPYGFAKQANIKTPIDVSIIDGKPVAYITAIDLSLLYVIISTLMTILDMKSGDNVKQELEEKKLQMLSIMNEASSLRTIIDTQKKGIAKMETMIDKIIRLSL